MKSAKGLPKSLVTPTKKKPISAPRSKKLADHSTTTSATTTEAPSHLSTATDLPSKDALPSTATSSTRNNKQHATGRRHRRSSSATGTDLKGDSVGNKHAQITEPAFELVNELKGQINLAKLKASLHDSPEEHDPSSSSSTSSSSDEGFTRAIEALNCFKGLKHVFMQRILNYRDVEALGITLHKAALAVSYKIFGIDGETLFVLEQKRILCSAFIVFTRRAFENTLYDTRGNKVLKFTGPRMVMSRMVSKMYITDKHGAHLGYIKAFGTRCNYSVYNSIGERLFLIVSNSFLPSDKTRFWILCRGQKIGMIRPNWKSTFQELPYITFDTPGVEFPSESDSREKALMIGCMMLIEFCYYSSLTKTKLSTLAVAVLLTVLAGAIFSIPLSTDPQPAFNKTRSYYSGEDHISEGENLKSFWGG